VFATAFSLMRGNKKTTYYVVAINRNSSIISETGGTIINLPWKV